MTDVVEQGGVVDLTVFRGGSFSFSFQLCEQDQVTPLVITGFTTGQAQMRDKAGDTGVALADFGVAVDVPSATVTLTLTHAQTVALAGDGVYDVALVHTNGIDVLYVLQGLVTLDERVTIVS